MENFYLRNLHAQFYDDADGKKILVYFETHMDAGWDLKPVQLPQDNTVIQSDLTLKFDIIEIPDDKQIFNVRSWKYNYPVDLPDGFRHITSVILFHSQGADGESVGTAGDPT